MDCFLPLPELLRAGAFTGRSVQARERAARRWAEALPASEARKEGGAWSVSGSARLPNRQNQTVAAFLADGAAEKLGGYTLPPNHLEWNEKDRQVVLNKYKHISNVDSYIAEQKLLAPRLSEANTLKGFALTPDGQWALSQGLSCNPRTINRYRKRLKMDGGIDQRGRWKRSPEKAAERCDPEAWRAFESLFLDTNQLSVAEAHRIITAESKLRGWAWPSLRTIQQRAKRDIPEALKVYGRQGQRLYTAKCLPKIKREYGDVPAGSHICGDERTCDFWAREICSRRGWRAIRPKVTVWQDIGSRMIWGWDMSEYANSNTILAAFKSGAKTHGLPTEATIDNGSDYKVVGGKRRRKWDDFDARRIGTVFDQTGITAHYCIPYQPWSKIIESFFGTMASQFDKHQPAYCGGKPEDRPADMAVRLGDVMTLPTVGEVRTAFDAWLRVYHASPHSGDGMNGLTPNLVMESRRGTVRTCSPEVLDLLCARLVGPATVGRDGIRWRGITYGQMNEEVFVLQGRKVWLRIDPDQAESVVVCDEKGAPICVASNRRLKGITQEDVRKAAQYRGRLTKAVKEYMKGRLDLLDTRPENIIALKRAAADAAENELRNRLPAVENKPEVVIVRPDLHEPAKKIAKQKRDRTAFDRLAEANRGNEQTGERRLVSAGEFFAANFGKEPQQEPATDAPGFDWGEYYRRTQAEHGGSRQVEAG